jgi:hypothetical protein
MAGIAGCEIGLTTVQPPIGAYVEASTENFLAANTNYIGYNSFLKQTTNRLGEGSIVTGPTIAPQPDFIVPDNDNDVTGGTSQWVRAAGTIAANGTCTVTAGAATAGAGTYSCYVPTGVVEGDFFWAVLTAES